MKQLLTFVVLLGSFYTFAQTQRIEFNAPSVYPEGITYYSKGKMFVVSSVTTGSIGMVDVQGNYKVFYKDRTLKSTFGMKVDEKSDRLWVCVSDPNYSKYSDSSTFKKMARVISLDLKSGKKMIDVDLAKLKPGKHFANDLTFDGKGNIYVTDSYAPMIYKVDQKGNATVFAENKKFKGNDVGLNGIVFHPDGYLLVAKNSDGVLLKIEIKEPKKIIEVKTSAFFPGADGLLLDPNNDLILIQNKGVNKVFRLASNDNWLTAEIKASTNTYDRFQNPTTATMMDRDIYVMNSKMNELADSTMGFSKAFSIQRATLTPIK